MRYQQPQGGSVRVDGGNPLARGLVSLAGLGSSLTHDSAGGVWAITQSGTSPSLGTAPKGRGLESGAGIGGYISRAQPASITTSTTQLLTFRYRLFINTMPSSGASGGVLQWASSATSGSPRYYARLRGAIPGIEFYYSTSGGVYRTPIVLQAGVEYVITHTFDGTTHSVYLNGVLQGTFAGPWNNTGGNFYIGRGFDAPQGDWIVSDFAVWSRALSASEVAADAANPWQVFASPRRAYRAIAASGPTYTLTANSGAIALGGASAGLIAGRKLVAASGALALAGGDAALRVSRRLAAGSGALELAGAPARIVAARRLAADAGALGLSGGDARLITSRRLTAGPGAIALSGSGSSLRAARRLVAGAGALSLGGGAATFTYTPSGSTTPTYTLVAESGGIALAGADAALVASRRLVAGSGEIVLSGSDARLAAQRVLTASPGSLELGGGALLIAARRLVAETCAITVSGSSATLSYSAQITFARAPSGNGYAPQRNEYQARPAQVGGERPAAIQRNNR